MDLRHALYVRRSYLPDHLRLVEKLDISEMTDWRSRGYYFLYIKYVNFEFMRHGVDVGTCDTASLSQSHSPRCPTLSTRELVQTAALPATCTDLHTIHLIG
jgi:hypothetical protein